MQVLFSSKIQSGQAEDASSFPECDGVGAVFQVTSLSSQIADHPHHYALGIIRRAQFDSISGCEPLEGNGIGLDSKSTIDSGPRYWAKGMRLGRGSKIDSGPQYWAKSMRLD